MIGLSRITKLDQSVLPANMKPGKDTLETVLETYKKDNKEEPATIPPVSLKVSGLTGLKELDLSGFDRETLAGLDAATLTSLEKLIFLATNLIWLQEQKIDKFLILCYQLSAIMLEAMNKQ